MRVGASVELIYLLVGVSMVMSVIWVIVVAYVYTDKAESYLPSSEYVQGIRHLYFHAGLVGMAFRSGSIALVLIAPASLLKKGLLNPEEVRCFPQGLKRMLCVSWALATLFWSVGMILGLYEKYKDAIGS